MTPKRNNRRTAALAALCVATSIGVLFGTSVRTAMADQKPETGMVFASIDMQKAADDSKLRQQAEDDWREYTEGLDKVLQHLAGSSARLLSDAEIHELAALYEKTPPLADADQKRVTALEQKADATGAELSGLQQKPSPTDDEKKRYTQLTDIQKKGDTILHSLQDDYQNRAQQKHDQLYQKLASQIRDAVAKVAKEKGLTVVFDAQVAVYTQNDITAEVVKKLTK